MAIVPMRTYVETSVFGGVFDDEFGEPSRSFFEKLRSGCFLPVISDVVVREIAGAPIVVRKLLAEYLPMTEVAAVTPEALVLRDAYISAEILTSNALNDALHIAVATLNRCELIASWNFKHIVNFRRIPKFNAVNTLNGYGSIMIHSPLEIIENDEEEDV